VAIEFSLADDVANSFPDAHICFVVASGVRNEGPWPETVDELARLERQIADGSWQPFDKEHPTIASWHEGVSEVRHQSESDSVQCGRSESAVDRGGVLPRINPAVDSYNFVSVTFGRPLARTISTRLTDRRAGEYQVRPTRDVFTPLGEPDVTEKPNDGRSSTPRATGPVPSLESSRTRIRRRSARRPGTSCSCWNGSSETAVPTARLEEAQATLTKPFSNTRISRDGGYQRTAANHDSLAT